MKIFAPIAKIDEEQRMVYGYASTEALDSQGEVVKRDAIKAALPDYLKFGNIREMHQPSAVGVAKGAEMDDTGLYLSAKVVDDAAWIKVKEGVYKGFSIGGAVKGRDPANKAIITDLALMEISLVDRPANPEAVFEMFKSDLAIDLEKSTGLLKQAWTCCHPGHEHLTKAEAVTCIEATPAEERTEEARLAKRRAIEAGPVFAQFLEKAAVGLEPVVTPLTNAIPKGADHMKKGMYQVAWLADIVSCLDSLQADTRMEAMFEGDGSTIPAKLKAAVDNLAGVLKEMVTEEAAEIAAANAKTETVVEVIEAADNPGDLAKAAEPSPPAEDLAKAALTDTIQKAIADALAPIQAKNEALEKRVADLAAQPMPAKGALKVIEKGGAAEPSDEDLLKKFTSMTPEQQTHLLTKAALRKPQIMSRPA
jgi:phage head maturation protease